MTTAQRLSKDLIAIHEGHADEGPTVFTEAAALLLKQEAALKLAEDALESQRQGLIDMRTHAEAYGEAYAAAYVDAYRNLRAGSAEQQFRLLALMHERLNKVAEGIVNGAAALTAIKELK